MKSKDVVGAMLLGMMAVIMTDRALSPEIDIATRKYKETWISTAELRVNLPWDPNIVRIFDGTFEFDAENGNVWADIKSRTDWSEPEIPGEKTLFGYRGDIRKFF